MRAPRSIAAALLLASIPTLAYAQPQDPGDMSQQLQAMKSMVSSRNIDLQSLNKKYRNAVVLIEFTPIRNLSETILNPTKSENYSGLDTKGSHGTGFFINEDEILTNAHVVEAARKGSIHIKSPATGNVKFKVTVVGIGGSGSIDLAVLHFPKDEQMRLRKLSGLSSIPALKFGDSDELDQSDPLAIFGYPTISDELKVIQAEVTGRQYQKYPGYGFLTKHQYIEVGPGGVVQEGNSGGPALDKKGLVVGMPTLGDWRGNQGWLIPINLVRAFLGRIRENQQGKISLDIPELGLVLTKNTDGTSVWAGAPEDITLFELGVVVREVIPHRQAEQWGLKPGDIIVGFANKQKGLSCALDFEGYRVVTGKMAAWPQNESAVSNLNEPKLHLEEMVFISEPGDEIMVWFIRPGTPGSREGTAEIKTISATIRIRKESILPHIGLYVKPEYELWGDFVAQDFNDYNTLMFKVPVREVLKRGVLITYVEPNSLASHRGIEISSRTGLNYLFGGGLGMLNQWYIIETVNGKPVENLKQFKKELRSAETAFERLKQSRTYKPERKNLYKERYVLIGLRTNSEDGEIVKLAPAFPIDLALECCR